MTVHEVGYNYVHPKNFEINRPNGQHVCSAVVITSSAFIQLNGQKIKIEPETVIIFTKGTPMHYGSTGEEFSNNWFHFTINDYSFFENLRIPLNTPIHGFSTTQLSSIILNLFNERTLDGLYSTEISKQLAKMFFYMLARLIPSEKKTTVPYELLNVRNAIFNEPQKNWNIDSLCAIAGYSRSYFQHRYKESFGTSPQKDVIESKIIYAKYLLENTQYRANEIAFLCGFTDEPHFNHTFKKKTGMSPLQYRKTLL